MKKTLWYVITGVLLLVVLGCADSDPRALGQDTAFGDADGDGVPDDEEDADEDGIPDVEDEDDDNDGIPDFADGFNWDGTPGNDDDTPPTAAQGEQFAPLVITFPRSIDFAKARFRIRRLSRNFFIAIRLTPPPALWKHLSRQDSACPRCEPHN